MTVGNQAGGNRRRRARVLATLVGGALAVSGVVAVGAALAGQHPAPPQPPSQGSGSGPGSAAAPASPEPSTPTGGNDARTNGTGKNDDGASSAQGSSARGADESADTLALDYSEPVRVSIPSIDVSSTLVDLGLDDEGVMETPQDPDKAGWFTPSPAPGVPGASVIAGHVTWNQEPVVFFRLGELRKGDRVEVARKDGTTAVFEVTRVGKFPKDSFPTEAVYGQVDHPGLRLITCGGVYDEQTNNYQANLIVWAKMVGSHPTRT